MTIDTSVGGLWFQDDVGAISEIINNQRTVNYNKNLHPLFRGCTNCECWTLGVQQSDLSTSVLFGTAPSTGPAPWYSAATTASGEFLGMMVDTVDGLDYSHLERTVNQRASDGSNLTPLRAAGREITFTCLATALSERGMRYGLDWMARQLANLGGRCGFGKALMYLYCPKQPLSGQWSGRVEIREVALKSGPNWTSVMLDQNGCLVRQVMFTLQANDPCFYISSANCYAPTNYTLPSYNLNTLVCTNGINASKLICGPIDHDAFTPDTTAPFCEMPIANALETRAASITLEQESGTNGPFMIEAYAYTPGATRAQVWANGTYLGRIGVDKITAPAATLIDGVSGLIWSRPNDTTAWSTDDTQLLFPTSEFPVFPSYSGPLSLYVLVRPYYICNSGGVTKVSIDKTSIFACVGG